MRTYQHKTLQGQHLLKNDKFSDTWQPVQGEFCKLASLHSNNPLTEPSQRRWTNNTWRCETCQGRSICHFPWCLQGGMDCDGLIAVHSDIPTLHGSSAVSSLWNIWSFMVCKSTITNPWRRRWWSRVCNEWADPEPRDPLAAKYANIKWSGADLWCCYNLRGPGLHSIIEKIWIRNRNNKSSGKWLDSSWHCCSQSISFN